MDGMDRVSREKRGQTQWIKDSIFIPDEQAKHAEVQHADPDSDRFVQPVQILLQFLLPGYLSQLVYSST
jgi:hypothetical protein